MKSSIKLLLLLLIGSAISLSFIQQNGENNRIYWSIDRKLTWNDYKGTPPEQHPYKAITSYRVTYGNDFKEDTVIFTVKCYVKPNESWVTEDAKTERLLKHEQLHFDIGELYARKLRKELSLGKYFLQNANAEMKRIGSATSTDRKIAQEKYDEETEHALNAKKQEEWEKKIAKELKELDAFSISVIKVPLAK